MKQFAYLGSIKCSKVDCEQEVKVYYNGTEQAKEFLRNDR